MNKMQFMFDVKIQQHNNNVLCLPYKEFNRNFEFNFSADDHKFENVVTEQSEEAEEIRDIFSARLRRGYTGHIVKSDIKDSVLKQLKEMMAIIKKSRNELLYFKMNSTTKQKFRMYYNYEVDNVPKTTSLEDQFVGDIIGCLMGVKIVQDESLKNDVVQPLIKVEINGSMAQKLKKILN